MQRTGTIILADDDQNDFDLISFALETFGINNSVLWFKDGETLVDYLKQDHDSRQMPLVVLLDWNMPRMNPADVLKWIRVQPKYLNLLIVVLTGSESAVEKQLAYGAGANWHFVKTGDSATLMRLVQQIKEFWSPDVASHRRPVVDGRDGHGLQARG
jgi:CheY-like chemotaxis protein